MGGGTGGQARGGGVAGGKAAGVEAARAGVCLWSGPSPSPGFLGPLYRKDSDMTKQLSLSSQSLQGPTSKEQLYPPLSDFFSRVPWGT